VESVVPRSLAARSLSNLLISKLTQLLVVNLTVWAGGLVNGALKEMQ